MNEKKHSYNILPIADHDRHSVINFLKKYFFRDEPLNASKNLIKETESIKELEKYCDIYSQNGELFIIIHTILASNCIQKFVKHCQGIGKAKTFHN